MTANYNYLLVVREAMPEVHLNVVGHMQTFSVLSSLDIFMITDVHGSGSLHCKHASSCKAGTENEAMHA